MLLFPLCLLQVSWVSIRSGWGGRLLQAAWNEHTVGRSPGAQSCAHHHIDTKASWRIEGKGSVKEDLLRCKKCLYVIVSNELPVRHNARLELVGTLLTSVLSKLRAAAQSLEEGGAS